MCVQRLDSLSSDVQVQYSRTVVLVSYYIVSFSLGFVDLLLCSVLRKSTAWQYTGVETLPEMRRKPHLEKGTVDIIYIFMHITLFSKESISTQIAVQTLLS